MSFPKVSVIMPVYNAGLYIGDAIRSVISQTHPAWELLIIDDGSTDNTRQVVHSFADSRIKYYHQENRGVSDARNRGFENMSGEFFCLLDADDVFTPSSLEARLKLFSMKNEIYFIDGVIHIVDENLSPLKTFTPSLRDGNPFEELISLRSSCYLKQSWLIRRVPGKTYRMETALTHGEDLLFSMAISHEGGLYNFTNESILLYRTHNSSAMRNLDGLNHSYYFIFKYLKNWPKVNTFKRIAFLIKARKIMFLSYLFDGKSISKALLSLAKWK